METNAEGTYFQEGDHVRIKRTQEIGRAYASLYSSLLLQEGCTQEPEQVLNCKVLSLVDLYRVSKVARDTPPGAKSPRLLVPLLCMREMENCSVATTQYLP